MRRTSVPEPRLSRLLTTADAAKVLGLSRWGVLWLVQQGELACEPTRSGQRIFHSGDVQQCLLRRMDAKTRRRGDVLAAIHLRMLKAGIDPVQLSFFHGVGLRIVARGERALYIRRVKATPIGQNSAGSEKRRYVNRKVAH